MSLDMKIDARELQDVIRKFDRAGRVAGREARRTMTKSVNIIEEQVTGRTPKNTGKLQQSIDTDVSGSALTEITGKVFTPLVYGRPVEFGRKAGKWPPRDAIEYWVIRKGLAAPGKESRSVAFLIARAIGRGVSKGIMRPDGGAKMFTKGLKAARPHVERLWAALPGKIIARFK